MSTNLKTLLQSNDKKSQNFTVNQNKMNDDPDSRRKVVAFLMGRETYRQIDR